MYAGLTAANVDLEAAGHWGRAIRALCDNRSYAQWLAASTANLTGSPSRALPFLLGDLLCGCRHG
jgi:hypothetical protein